MKYRYLSTALMFSAMCCGLLAQAPPQSQAPAAQSPLAARFNYGGNAAEIPVDFAGEIPFLPVRVNQSRSSYFVLDSTANLSSIDPRRASELGVSTGQRPLLGLNGVDIPFAAIPQQQSPEFGTKIGRIYEGTLGNDFFQRVVVEIDYLRHTVRLYDPDTYQYSGQGKPLPLTFADGVPIVQAKLTEAKGKVLDAAFAVNTAIDASVVVSDRFAESHHLLSHWKTIPIFDAQVDAAPGSVVGRSKGFQLGTNLVQDTLVTFSRSDLPVAPDTKVAGEIGGGMLRRFTVVFDYPHHQLYLQPNSQFAYDDQEDKSGLTVIAKGPALKTFEIVQVEPKTPASSAGLQKGDIITGIDQDAAADLSLSEIRNLFHQIGHKYTLLIERNGQNKQVAIEMRRLIQD